MDLFQHELNGFSLYVMQSNENLVKVVNTFVTEIQRNPHADGSELLTKIIQAYGLKRSDFTDSDYQKLSNEVNYYYRLYGED